jgi:hypothetical protein
VHVKGEEGVCINFSKENEISVPQSNRVRDIYKFLVHFIILFTNIFHALNKI